MSVPRRLETDQEDRAQPQGAPNRQAAAAVAALRRQYSATSKNAALHTGSKISKKPESSELVAPRDANIVRPARRLTPGTAVSVRTRFGMVTDKCCLVIWLPARVLSAADAYHCTVKYSADLSHAFAGKIVRKPVDHVRVVVKAEQPRNKAPAPEKKDRLLRG